MRTERAEVGTRLEMNQEDRRKYRGVARHPLARQWMLKRLIEARDAAEAATTEAEVRSHAAEVEDITAELKRCGVGLERGK